MMELLADILSWALLLGGSALLLIGGIGLIRLPDVFARMHGAALIDTLGAVMILGGMMVQAGWTLITVKLLLIAVFLIFTSPTATHALARAALHDGIEPLLAKKPLVSSDGDEKEAGQSKT